MNHPPGDERSAGDLYDRHAGGTNRTADLDRALLAFAERMNRAAEGEPAEFRMDNLLVVARARG